MIILLSINYSIVLHFKSIVVLIYLLRTNVFEWEEVISFHMFVLFACTFQLERFVNAGGIDRLRVQHY